MTPASLRATFHDYVQEGRSLQTQYEGKMDVLVGMETEHTGAHSLELANELRQEYQLDYVMGSVHHVNGCVVKRFGCAHHLRSGQRKRRLFRTVLCFSGSP
jgi:histidinol-phosphatase (PHP family)